MLGAPTIINRIENTIIVIVNYGQNIDKVKQTFNENQYTVGFLLCQFVCVRMDRLVGYIVHSQHCKDLPKSWLEAY